MNPNNPNSNNPNDPNVTPNPFGQPVDPPGSVQPTPYQNNIGSTASASIGVNPAPAEPLPNPLQNSQVSAAGNPFLTDNPMTSMNQTPAPSIDTNPFLSSTPSPMDLNQPQSTAQDNPPSPTALPPQPALYQNDVVPVVPESSPIPTSSPYGAGLAAQDYSAPIQSGASQLPPISPNPSPDLGSIQPEPVPTFLPDNNIQPIPVQSGFPPMGEPASTLGEPASLTFGPAPLSPQSNDALMSALNMPQAGVSGIPSESAPTDLSHLIGSQPLTGMPSVPVSAPAAQPDTIFVPPASPEVPTNVVAGSKSGIPIWAFGMGALVLVIVLAASAYFILGLGKPAEETTSTPIQQPLTSPPKAVKPQVSPTIPSAPGGGSSTFGELQGASPAGQQILPPPGSPSTTTVPSALELLRQRQSAPPSP